MLRICIACREMLLHRVQLDFSACCFNSGSQSCDDLVEVVIICVERYPRLGAMSPTNGNP